MFLHSLFEKTLLSHFFHLSRLSLIRGLFKVATKYALVYKKERIHNKFQAIVIFEKSLKMDICLFKQNH